MLTNEEKAVLLAILMRKRSKARQQALMMVRDRKIAALVRGGRSTLPQLISVVRWELEALAAAAGAIEADAVRRMADQYSRRIAFSLLADTDYTIAMSKPQNIAWATEDAFVRAGGNVIKFVARETGTNVQWFTERDNRVCAVCEPRDGVVYAAEEAPELPAHPRCRCALVPVAMRIAA